MINDVTGWPSSFALFITSSCPIIIIITCIIMYTQFYDIFLSSYIEIMYYIFYQSINNMMTKKTETEKDRQHGNSDAILLLINIFLLPESLWLRFQDTPIIILKRLIYMSRKIYMHYIRNSHTWNNFSSHVTSFHVLELSEFHKLGTRIVSTCCKTLKLSVKNYI